MGPEPTMTKSTVSWPSARIAAAISRPASRSVRPGDEELGHPGVHPVDGLTRAAQRVDLVGGLAHPQVAEHVGPEALLGIGQGGPEPEHLLGPHPVRQADQPGVPEAGGDGGVRALGLSPADDLDAQRRHWRRLDGGDLEARRDEERVAVGGEDKAGEALQRERLVAGQPGQVRPGCHEEGVQAGRGDGLARV